MERISSSNEPTTGNDPARKAPWTKIGAAGAGLLVLVGVVATQLIDNGGTEAAVDTAPTFEQPSVINSPTPPVESPGPTTNAPSSTSSSAPVPGPTASPTGLATAVTTDLPDFAASGWASTALDAAYCQTEGRFVTLADSQNFRGVICAVDGDYEYRGMDKMTGLTVTTPAEKTSNGYAGLAQDTRYELGPDTFDIVTNSGVLASEAVLTWLTPDEDPFIPGELGLVKPISFPECDGAGVVILTNSFGPEASKEDIQNVLDTHPSAEYLRTDLSCDAFNRPSSDGSGGEYIYASYIHVGHDITQLCNVAAAENGTAVWLQNDVEPAEARADCP